jgi:hypothetical protein
MAFPNEGGTGLVIMLQRERAHSAGVQQRRAVQWPGPPAPRSANLPTHITASCTAPSPQADFTEALGWSTTGGGCAGQRGPW